MLVNYLGDHLGTFGMLALGVLVVSLVWVGRSWRRLRAMSSTRTRTCAELAARLKESPTGTPVPAEITGTAAPGPDGPLSSTHFETPCVWHRSRYNSPGEGGGSWSTISDRPFVVDDGSGQVLVYPSGARVESVHERRERSGRFTYDEKTLPPGGELYLRGTVQAADGQLVMRPDQGGPYLISTFSEKETATRIRGAVQAGFVFAGVALVVIVLDALVF